MNGSGHWFDDLAEGESFSRAVTITETHLVLSAGLLGDYNPLHVDEEFARKSRFGGRILHGMMTSALMGGPVGMYFHGTAIAYLEHNARFAAPVRPGDTLDHRVDDHAARAQAGARRRHRRTRRHRDESGRRGRGHHHRQDHGVQPALKERARQGRASARTHSATSAGPR